MKERPSCNGVVLTCLFTTMPDPLAPLDPGRKKYWEPDLHIADTLLKSLQGEEVVVFHDSLVIRNDLKDLSSSPALVPVITTAPCATLQRWISYRQWLLAHSEVALAWCVDINDTECLAPDRLWNLTPGVLYCGCEPSPMGIGWMLDNHPASHDWIVEHADQPLLNAGVVGGDRDILLEFMDRLLGFWEQGLAEGKQDTVGDMGYFCRAAYSMPHEAGPHITTEFWKFDRTNTTAIFRHK